MAQAASIMLIISWVASRAYPSIIGGVSSTNYESSWLGTLAIEIALHNKITMILFFLAAIGFLSFIWLARENNRIGTQYTIWTWLVLLLIGGLAFVALNSIFSGIPILDLIDMIIGREPHVNLGEVSPHVVHAGFGGMTPLIFFGLALRGNSQSSQEHPRTIKDLIDQIIPNFESHMSDYENRLRNLENRRSGKSEISEEEKEARADLMTLYGLRKTLTKLSHEDRYGPYLLDRLFLSAVLEDKPIPEELHLLFHPSLLHQIETKRRLAQDIRPGLLYELIDHQKNRYKHKLQKEFESRLMEEGDDSGEEFSLQEVDPSRIEVEIIKELRRFQKSLHGISVHKLLFRAITGQLPSEIPNFGLIDSLANETGLVITLRAQLATASDAAKPGSTENPLGVLALTGDGILGNFKKLQDALDEELRDPRTAQRNKELQNRYTSEQEEPDQFEDIDVLDDEDDFPNMTLKSVALWFAMGFGLFSLLSVFAILLPTGGGAISLGGSPYLFATLPYQPEFLHLALSLITVAGIGWSLKGIRQPSNRETYYEFNVPFSENYMKSNLGDVSGQLETFGLAMEAFGRVAEVLLDNDKPLNFEQLRRGERQGAPITYFALEESQEYEEGARRGRLIFRINSRKPNDEEVLNIGWLSFGVKGKGISFKLIPNPEQAALNQDEVIETFKGIIEFVHWIQHETKKGNHLLFDANQPMKLTQTYRLENIPYALAKGVKKGFPFWVLLVGLGTTVFALQYFQGIELFAELFPKGSSQVTQIAGVSPIQLLIVLGLVVTETWKALNIKKHPQTVEDLVDDILPEIERALEDRERLAIDILTKNFRENEPSALATDEDLEVEVRELDENDKIMGELFRLRNQLIALGNAEELRIERISHLIVRAILQDQRIARKIKPLIHPRLLKQIRLRQRKAKQLHPKLLGELVERRIQELQTAINDDELVVETAQEEMHKPERVDSIERFGDPRKNEGRARNRSEINQEKLDELLDFLGKVGQMDVQSYVSRYILGVLPDDYLIPISISRDENLGKAFRSNLSMTREAFNTEDGTETLEELAWMGDELFSLLMELQEEVGLVQPSFEDPIVDVYVDRTEEQLHPSEDIHRTELENQVRKILKELEIGEVIELKSKYAPGSALIRAEDLTTEALKEILLDYELRLQQARDFAANSEFGLRLFSGEENSDDYPSDDDNHNDKGIELNNGVFLALPLTLLTFGLITPVAFVISSVTLTIIFFSVRSETFRSVLLKVIKSPVKLLGLVRGFFESRAAFDLAYRTKSLRDNLVLKPARATLLAALLAIGASGPVLASVQKNDYQNGQPLVTAIENVDPLLQTQNQLRHDVFFQNYLETIVQQPNVSIDEIIDQLDSKEEAMQTRSTLFNIGELDNDVMTESRLSDLERTLVRAELDRFDGIQHNVVINLFDNVSDQQAEKVQELANQFPRRVIVLKINAHAADVVGEDGLYDIEKLSQVALLEANKVVGSDFSALRKIVSMTVSDPELRLNTQVPTNFHSGSQLRNYLVILANMGHGYQLYGPGSLDLIMKAANLLDIMA